MAVVTDEELEWVKDKTDKAFANQKKVVFMCHHQLFSLSETYVKDSGKTLLAFNENLYNQFKEIIPKLSAWYWAHEHNFVLY